MNHRSKLKQAIQAGEQPERLPLSIVYRRIVDLKPDPENPRNHSSKQLRQIGRSIEAFGFNVPVLVDVDGKILAGHGRVLACEKLGWKTVPTISIDHLSAAQMRCSTAHPAGITFLIAS